MARLRNTFKPHGLYLLERSSAIFLAVFRGGQNWKYSWRLFFKILKETVFFDLVFGTNTSVIINVEDFETESINRSAAVLHMPSWTSTLIKAHNWISAERPDYLRADFVDVGAGAGKAMLLWALLAERRGGVRVQGIEFEKTLARLARENFLAKRFASLTLELFEEDFFSPDALCSERNQKTIYWLYNPFNRMATNQFCEKIAANEHGSLVAYVNPVWETELESAGFEVVARFDSFHPSGRLTILEVPPMLAENIVDTKSRNVE